MYFSVCLAVCSLFYFYVLLLCWVLCILCVLCFCVFMFLCIFILSFLLFVLCTYQWSFRKIPSQPNTGLRNAWRSSDTLTMGTALIPMGSCGFLTMGNGVPKRSPSKWSLVQAMPPEIIVSHRIVSNMDRGNNVVNYLHRWGYVFALVCLSVSRITQNVVDEWRWPVLESLGLWHWHWQTIRDWSWSGLWCKSTNF